MSEFLNIFEGYLSDDECTINEAKKKWSGKVDAEWEPKENFFKGSAKSIASGLKKNSKDLKQAMSRLNFYINRGGKNLSADDKERLNTAKETLKNLYK